MILRHANGLKDLCEIYFDSVPCPGPPPPQQENDEPEAKKARRQCCAKRALGIQYRAGALDLTCRHKPFELRDDGSVVYKEPVCGATFHLADGWHSKGSLLRHLEVAHQITLQSNNQCWEQSRKEGSPGVTVSSCSPVAQRANSERALITAIVKHCVPKAIFDENAMREAMQNGIHSATDFTALVAALAEVLRTEFMEEHAGCHVSLCADLGTVGDQHTINFVVVGRGRTGTVTAFTARVIILHESDYESLPSLVEQVITQIETCAMSQPLPAVTVAAFVCDNAPNIVNAGSLSTIPVIRCSCHRIQLAVKQLIESEFQKMVRLCLYAREASSVKMPRVVETRWWTLLTAMEHVHRHWDTLVVEGAVDKRKYVMLDDAIKALLPTRIVARVLEKDAATLPMYCKVLGSLLLSPRRNYFINTLAADAIFPAMILCVGLSPSFDPLNAPDHHSILLHHPDVKLEFRRMVNAVANNAQLDHYNTDFTEFVKRGETICDATTWSEAWTSYSAKYPHLFHVARFLDQITSSEASVERSFGVQESVIDLRRWQLGASNTEAEAIVAFNAERQQKLEAIDVDDDDTMKNGNTERADNTVWYPSYAEACAILKMYNRWLKLSELTVGRLVTVPNNDCVDWEVISRNMEQGEVTIASSQQKKILSMTNEETFCIKSQYLHDKGEKNFLESL